VNFAAIKNPSPLENLPSAIIVGVDLVCPRVADVGLAVINVGDISIDAEVHLKRADLINANIARIFRRRFYAG